MSDPVKLGVIHFNYLSEDIPAYLNHLQELTYGIILFILPRKFNISSLGVQVLGFSLYTPCILFIKHLSM
jgi:hypothetical protein